MVCLSSLFLSWLLHKNIKWKICIYVTIHNIPYLFYPFHNLLFVFSNRVAEVLEGKGSCSRGPYQGKANKLSHKAKAEKLVREYMSGINNESWCQIKLKIEKLVGKYMWGINNESWFIMNSVIDY